ncbi:MAG: glucose 1-dehydrogenase [Armatimonadota bacterium]|nr:glucose 1-dehydrogenase [Armatimonadota bacterium]
MRLSGRVAIITGGGLGIGRAYALGFAREGAAVAVADIDAAAAAAVAAEIGGRGGRAIPIPVDVADDEAVRRMCEETAEAFGGIDILVNNAALFAALERKPFHAITPEEWDRVMAVNLRGVFLCCRAAYPYLKARGGGSIINITSSSIFTARNRLAHYVAAKMGVVGLTRALAREMGDDGIRVNAVAPGVTASGTNERISPPEAQAAAAAERCLKRIQVPEDLVGTVLFLASDEGAFISGQMIVVDGGRVFH